MATMPGVSGNVRLNPKPPGVADGQSPIELAELIEGEIIPRLLVAHRRDTNVPVVVGVAEAESKKSRLISQNDIAQFVDLALDQQAHILIRQVDEMLDRGFAVEAILIDLLAPVARLLGEKWESDEVDFIEVTMGLWRLQEIVHDLAARVPGVAPDPDSDRRALFALMPGDQHCFGTLLIDECFRRRGWSTQCLTAATEAQLVSVVEERWFELIGLTVPTDHHIDALPRLIAALRKASRNPHVGVLVGGHVFINNPALVLHVGADATAPDARQAFDRAESLLVEISARVSAPV
jgi:MerR family transcriptional regulator, light-induced transcriptional regulator